MNDATKTEKPIEIIRSLKDNEYFQAEKKSCVILHLKGIGKYCPVDGKKINPKLVKYRLNGKWIKRYVVSKYCSKKCYNKVYDRKREKENSLYARINMNVINDNLPFREMTLYLTKGRKFKFKITKESKELWDYLERLTRYKTIPKEIIISCQ